MAKIKKTKKITVKKRKIDSKSHASKRKREVPATAKAQSSSRAPEPVGLYPHSIHAGDFLFLSGVGPRERGKKEIPGVEMNAEGKVASYDIEKQCRSVFANVRAILEDSGANWNDLVDVTVYLTNMKKDFPIYNRLWAEYFAENRPCRTTIEILSLPTPIAIELKCIAYLPANKKARKRGGK